jgi:hypothetical protein
MTDEALRRSAREAATTDDVAARARLLGDELRAGVRSRGDVELLAYLADPAALLLFDEPAPDLTGEDGPVLWMRGFLGWGPEVLARAVVAWLWSCEQSARPVEYLDVGIQRQFLAAIEAWWIDPTKWAEVQAARNVEAWNARAGWHARTMSVAIECFASGDTTGTLEQIELAQVLPPGPSIATEHLAPRLGAWVLSSRPRFTQLPGAGPVWRRAIDAGTPPARRALVASLRRRRGDVVRVRIRGQPMDLVVDGVDFTTVHFDSKRVVELDHVELLEDMGA